MCTRHDWLNMFLAFLALALGGCASRLLVFGVSDNPAAVKGIRIHQRVPYILTKQIETQNCPPRTEESVTHLPIGDAYEINFEAAQFGKSEFTVALADDGALKQVTLNSTPQLAETIKSLAELTEKVSKFAIAPAAGPNCGAMLKETIVSARRLPIASK